MTLEEVREQIDALDPGIRDLLMKRMDLSCHVAEAKKASGDLRVYLPDREAEILEHLGQEVPEERKAPYLAVVRKIMETSRMYQYGLLFDWTEGLFEPLAEGLFIPEKNGVCKDSADQTGPAGFHVFCSWHGVRLRFQYEIHDPAGGGSGKGEGHL